MRCVERWRWKKAALNGWQRYKSGKLWAYIEKNGRIKNSNRCTRVLENWIGAKSVLLARFLVCLLNYSKAELIYRSCLNVGMQSHR